MWIAGQALPPLPAAPCTRRERHRTKTQSRLGAAARSCGWHGRPDWCIVGRSGRQEVTRRRMHAMQRAAPGQLFRPGMVGGRGPCAGVAVQSQDWAASPVGGRRTGSSCLQNRPVWSMCSKRPHASQLPLATACAACKRLGSAVDGIACSAGLVCMPLSVPATVAWQRWPAQLTREGTAVNRAVSASAAAAESLFRTASAPDRFCALTPSAS